MEEREAFASTVRAYQDKIQDLHKFNLDIMRRSEWNDSLLQAANIAQYDADVIAASGMKGALRDCARRLGRAGPSFVEWLGLLPDDAYGSAICGGFQIIIRAAIRHKELCEEVLAALGEIPETVTNAQFFLNVYNMSGEIHIRVADLYTTITEALHGILQFYKDRAPDRRMRAAWNAVKAIGKGPAYGEKIKLDLKLIRDSAALLQQEAERCSHGRLGDVHKAQEYQTFQAARSERTATESLKVQQNTYNLLKYQMKCWKDYWKKESEWRDQMQAFLERTRAKELTQKNGPSPRRILELMQTSFDMISIDSQRVLQDAPNFAKDVQAQVRELVASDKLQNWLTTPYSCALMVQGTSGDDRISALSFVATLLMQSVHNSTDTSVLSFFCGLHTDAYIDDLASGTGIIRSLVTQLILSVQYEFDLELVDRKFFRALENHRLDAVLNLFEDLIQQLPNGRTTFLIIDGISFFETHDRLQDTRYAMTKIVGLVENAPSLVKLLVTSPGASAQIYKLFDKDQIYWLHEEEAEQDDDFDYNVECFRESAMNQSGIPKKALMRSQSEFYEAY